MANETLTKAEAIKLLQQLLPLGDIEAQHEEASSILCAFLRGIGHADLVEEFERIDKWYA